MRYTTPSGKRAVYYFAEWGVYGRNFQIKDIPENITDIAYAFFNLDSTGKVYSGDSWATFEKRYTDGVAPQDTWDSTQAFFGNFGQLKKLKDSGREINIQLSIGGWTWSKYFSDAMSTQTTRQNMISHIIQIFKTYPIFNGISLDWEYLTSNGVNYGNVGNTVRPEDSKNFAQFLKDLRSAFNSNGMNDYIMSFCCCAAPEKNVWDINEIVNLLDEIHIMTYDFHDGNWGETKSAHQTNPRKNPYGVWSAEEAVDFFLSKGVPSTKLFIGGALYSRGFNNTDGLGKPAQGGSPDMSWEAGIVDYKDLPKAGAQEFFDPIGKANYSYDASKKIFNSYDGPASIMEKCKMIFEKNLGGIIIWELSGDIRDPNNARKLTKVISDNLTHTLTPLPVPMTPPPVPITPLPVPTTPVPITPLPVPTTPVPVEYTPPKIIVFSDKVIYNSKTYFAIIEKINGINYLTLTPTPATPATPATPVPTPTPVPVPTPTPVPIPVPVPQNKLKISFDLDVVSKKLSNVQIS